MELAEGAHKRLQSLQDALKRAIDVVGALLALILFSVPMMILAVAIKVSSRGPVLFKQQRIGRSGVPFWIYKFRTMHRDAEDLLRANQQLYAKYVESGYKLPAGEDPRITVLGRLLRRSSLDELPQIFNVLAGSMSLVGPRPVLASELELYGHRASIFLSVKPGMTGFWQVSGRSSVGYPERIDVELHYVYNWSLWLDLKILVLTIPSVLRQRGAH